MWTLIIKRALVFVGILTVVPVLYVGLLLIAGRFVFGSHDAAASAEVWLDTNGNGRKDYGEPPLSGVCTWAGYMPYAYDDDERNHLCERVESGSFTDREGRWGQFFPGGACSELSVFAKPPKGYQPTTNLAMSGCDGHFGFVPEGAIPKIQVLLPAEYAQREDTNGRLKLIGFTLLSFGFAGYISVKLVRPNRNRKDAIEPEVSVR